MKKTINQICEDFQKELIENDKKVQEELKQKNSDALSEEFKKFVNDNKCKIMGGKNDKK